MIVEATVSWPILTQITGETALIAVILGRDPEIIENGCYTVVRTLILGWHADVNIRDRVSYSWHSEQIIYVFVLARKDRDLLRRS